MIKNILIATKPDDEHAVFVKLALEKMGHTAMLWYTADYPQHQKHSFEVINNRIQWDATGVDFCILPHTQFDSVWLRRPRRPVLSDTIHPDDRVNAKNENAELFKAFWYTIAPYAFWVNPIKPSRSVNCKLYQLKTALELGIPIPRTLVSNHPERVKAFIDANGINKTIYKTLCPVYWVNDQDNELRLTYTREIQKENLPSDAMLANTPGIYQEKIEKAYELRLTYFGEKVIAAKLYSQDHPKAVLDWRAAPAYELVVEECDLPDAVNNMCKAFMRKTGLVFGCFDFIVTPQNEYYFLEVNEQGQFLWIEEVNPNIKMLEAFTQFLIQGSDPSFRTKGKSSIYLADFIESVQKIKQNAMQRHQDPGMFF
jgi:glutathione synthase/RimK-type ligase-like ATP-grasp enzyme